MLTLCFALLLLTATAIAHAQVVAAGGCPLFHCTAEATGVMPLPLVQQVPFTNSNAALGKLKFQGCSGDGQRLACLYASDSDNAPAASAGTLKVLDASTLQPMWGSAAAGSYNPAAGDTSGQVPFVFADGSVAAGDATQHVLYDSHGAVLASLAVGGGGNNFGLTPIDAGHAVVSQNDGVLTLVDMTTWQQVDVLSLRDPQTQARVTLVSPSSGSNGVVYAIGSASKNNHGLLFAVAVDAATHKLVVRACWTFLGRSGASAVVVAPAVSGLPNNLVLVHAPGLIGDTQLQDRLVALVDNGVTLTQAWALPLAAALPVAPSIERTTQSLFYVYKTDTKVHQVNFLTGAPVRDFDIAAIAGMPAGFSLNGHLAAMQWGTTYTMLLSGAVPAGQSGAGQYVMTFEPIDMPNAMLWLKKIGSRPDSYTAAWNAAPALQPGAACPVVVGTNSGITRLCDFAP